jgi:hypothetical protein
MNKLQLCQKLQIECGVSGTLTTSVDQVGSLGRLVNWIDQAWNDLQITRDDWDFMRSSNILGAGMSFATVAGQPNYPLGSGAGTCGVTEGTFGKWVRGSFRNQVTSVGVSSEIVMDDIPYDTWRDGYMYGAQRSVQTRPVVVSIGPDQAICLGPPPNGLYTVTGDYFMAPTVMEDDTDTPTGLPTQFHYLIVYFAMEMYGDYEAAPEVSARGIKGKKRMMALLQPTNSPEIAFAGALC